MKRNGIISTMAVIILILSCSDPGRDKDYYIRIITKTNASIM